MLYIINFKAYSKGTGLSALRLANIIAEVADINRVQIIPAVQPADLSKISKVVPSIAQHIDPITYGANTGKILPQSVRDAGAVGSIINHSERKLSLPEIKECILIARLCKLKSICCAADIKEAMDIAKFGPDYLAFEDPELIGTGRSVSKTKPDLVRRFVEVLEEINPSVVPLCGAGIVNRDDVFAAKELGARGVLASSAIVNAPDQRKALENLIL
jgi:triosephosphate isomerase